MELVGFIILAAAVSFSMKLLWDLIRVMLKDRKSITLNVPTREIKKHLPFFETRSVLRAKIHELQNQLTEKERLIEELYEKIDHFEDACDRHIKEIKILNEKIVKMNLPAGSAPSPDWKFREVKAAFARLYHPDRTTQAGIERIVREQVFKEFWREIERIDRKNSP